MEGCIIAVSEDGRFFDGNFEESQLYLIKDLSKNEFYTLANLENINIKDYILLGSKSSLEFKEKLKQRNIEFIFTDFQNIDNAMEYYDEYLKKIEIFNKNTSDYEIWFSRNELIYKSEIKALALAIPEGNGVEIGIGSGRFAIPLGIKKGVEPAVEMAKIASQNGIEVIRGVAENLPLEDNSFDFALMAVTICFVNDPLRSLKECYRILKPKGKLIVGIVDKDTSLGRFYLKKKENSVFYKYARFFSSSEIIDLFSTASFKYIGAYQTLFGNYQQISTIQKPKLGFGEGGFAVLIGEKDD